MRSKSLLAVLIGVVVGLSSCISFPAPAFHWTRGEHHVRIDGDKDVVEWIEILHGLCEPTAEFHGQMKRVLARERLFPPGGGFISLDFETDCDELRQRDSDGDDLEEALCELAPSLRVLEARLVYDDAGLITLWRRVRFERASEWHAALQRQLATAEMAPEDADDAPVGVNLAVEAARANTLRWQLDGDSFLVEARLDEANAQRWIALFRADPVDPELRKPAEIAFDGTTLRVRYLPDDSGWIGVHAYPSDGAEWGVHPEGVNSLIKETSLSIEPTEKYLELRREAGLDGGK